MAAGSAESRNSSTAQASRVAVLLQRNDDAVAHFGLATQHRFQVSGINIHSRAGDDHIFLTALEIKIAAFVQLAQIAGGKPTVFVDHRLQFITLPIACRDIGAAHQDLAAFVQLHLAAFQYFSDGSLAGAEGMIERDERRGFRKSVALDHDKAQATPEFFRPGIQRCAAEKMNAQNFQPKR